MLSRLLLFTFMLAFTIVGSCKKDHNYVKEACDSGNPVVRVIANKKATVHVGATSAASGVYLTEEGTIDTRLIPCNFPMELYEDGLQVTITGNTKAMVVPANVPCCVEGIELLKISK